MAKTQVHFGLRVVCFTMIVMACEGKAVQNMERNESSVSAQHSSPWRNEDDAVSPSAPERRGTGSNGVSQPLQTTTEDAVYPTHQTTYTRFQHQSLDVRMEKDRGNIEGSTSKKTIDRDSGSNVISPSIVRTTSDAVYPTHQTTYTRLQHQSLDVKMGRDGGNYEDSALERTVVDNVHSHPRNAGSGVTGRTDKSSGQSSTEKPDETARESNADHALFSDASLEKTPDRVSPPASMKSGSSVSPKKSGDIVSHSPPESSGGSVRDSSPERYSDSVLYSSSETVTSVESDMDLSPGRTNDNGLQSHLGRAQADSTLHLSSQTTDHNVILMLPPYNRTYNTPMPPSSIDGSTRWPLSWQLCGHMGDLCKCQGSTANCSGPQSLYTRRMTFVPSFDRYISTLDFSRNYFFEIRISNFFDNVTYVINLDLSDNYISTLNSHAFKQLRRLRVLKIGGNHLGYPSDTLSDHKSLKPVMAVPTLKRLYLSGSDRGQLGRMPDDLFFKNPMPNLTTLWLDHNTLERLNMTAFKPLKKLQELNVASTELSDMKLDYMPSLERLYASNNDLLHFPVLCSYHDDVPYFPQLSHLDFDENRILYPPTKAYCLPRLVSLNLGSNYLRVIYPEEFASVDYHRLKFLYLRGAVSVDCRVGSKAFSSGTLLTIDLSNNGLDFASDRVDKDAFLDCANLHDLNLEGNSMRDVTEKRFHRLVDSLHSLKVLRLNDTRLDQVSKGRFQSLTNVTTLYLNKNILTKIPDGTFDDLEHLTVLTLDGNLITSVGENTFGPDMRRRLQSLNLSNNHFECTCSLLWFRKWLQSDPALFDYHNPYSRYECKNIPGSDVATFFLNEQQCLLSHESYIFIVVCFVIFILTLTVVTLLYRYRWHIRLAMYEVFRGDLLAKWRQRNPKDFQYDLFVSYSGEDVRWVIDHLIPGLEDQMGLRLCVHQRDFILGNNISDNIMDSLESSKRVLALFSRSFASSQWCQFEMELCLRHVIDNNDVMVVVLLEDVESRDLSGAMLALMKTTTYIEWGAKPEAVESFWRRMALALNDVLPGLH